ncbi:GNAT family N-acetyltransferase [Sansalvadorimonas sp. 2012CJ34-2]|uniref:GNAT family N-acetyltransferase n=1 Tax=Parendozoicomonas callyspongiae TaxID=2942213 RepID=A0ABT0PH57_9GAMM|nr:GNAT family protein [Sansalvadorimonas sp. 2012CJ34-2]MCL6270655.1 GNAT family N-acetyltransferase [Sansalvadorimonas sp. 2012CJ34-2]
MYLTVVSSDDLCHLYDFEYRNKDWFERFVPPREPGYFFFDDFKEHVGEHLAEQKRMKLLMFVVYRDNEIIARVNITNIQQGVAEIDYRVCQRVAGQGLATQAVKSVLDLCRDKYGINRVNAITTDNNVASQSVLLKNDFEFSHRDKDAYVLNGQSVDFVFFQKALGTV